MSGPSEPKKPDAKDPPETPGELSNDDADKVSGGQVRPRPTFNPQPDPPG